MEYIGIGTVPEDWSGFGWTTIQKKLQFLQKANKKQKCYALQPALDKQLLYNVCNKQA